MEPAGLPRERRFSWGPLAMGAICAGIALLGILYCLDRFDLSGHEGRLPPKAWVGPTAGLLLVLGAYWVFVAVRDAIVGVPRGNDAELMQALVPVTFLLLIMAVGVTYAALAAWFPGMGGSFEGGLTGTMVEHRIVWGLAALVIDLLALLFGLILFFLVIGRLFGRRPR